MALKKIVGNLFLTLIAIVFCFVILEVGLRFFAPQNSHFYQPDPVLGSRLIPNRSGVWTTEGRIVPIQINQFGFRGWEYPQEKPTGTIRIGVIGDSYVEALQVEEQEMFTHILEQRLGENDSSHQYEVLSFGTSGYGTVQEYLLWSSEIKKFDLDIVILAFTSGNDVRNNAPGLEQHETKPYATIKEGQLAFTPPVIKSYNIFGSINRVFLSWSHLYRLVLNRWYHLPWTQIGLNQNNIPTDYGVYACEYDEQWSDAWKTTERLLLQLRGEVTETDATFVLVNLTNYIQINSESGLKNATKKFPAMAEKCWDFLKPNSTLAAFSKANGMFYLDLLPAFRDNYTETGRELHLLQDGHWSVAGHEVAGSAIYQFLEKNIVSILSAPLSE